MKQSQLSQRLESVRQEMNYSAGGVDDLIQNSDDTTVESSRLASDDLAHYVLIKGSVNKEETDNGDAVTKEADAAADECDAEAEDDEWKPGRKSAQCRMNDQFVIRKIERDRNAGCRFAPVCEVMLSSSGSSSDEEDVDRRHIVKSADVKLSESVSAAESHDDVGSSATMMATKLMEEKRKLPPPEDVVETKRWKSDESSVDSMVEDEPNQAVTSPLVLKTDSDEEQELLTAAVAAETLIPDTQPITASSENDQSHQPAKDKLDELAAEVESVNKDINAETGEVCYKEPVNGKCYITLSL